MKYIKYKTDSQNTGDDNVFWVTMSDLLLGLVVVFLVLFVFAITGYTQSKVAEQKKRYEVTERIAEELKKNNINVDADKFSGRIKISDLELFELNSWELSPKGKEYMAKFVPVYLNAVLKDPKVRKNITQIVIEGHTDSQTFAGAKSEEEKYYRNMELSLKRAASVARYIIFSDYEGKKEYQNDLFKIISVEGKGPSNPVIINGQEDYAKSRRVELQVVFKENFMLGKDKASRND